MDDEYVVFKEFGDYVCDEEKRMKSRAKGEAGGDDGAGDAKAVKKKKK
jgi:hypothetical protein